MAKSPDITLFFLGASRAIRVAWVLEELNLPYKIVSALRAPNGLAPPEYKAKMPHALGKSPTLQDGDIVVVESGAIIEYLLETYDTEARLLPKDPKVRAKVREWIHAAEGTFMMHSISILYTRWKLPEPAKQYGPEMEESLSANVRNDFNWLEGELKSQKEKGSQFLVGNTLTAADATMQFSVQFIMERKLGVGGVGEGRWPEVEAWLKRSLEIDSYKKAVEKTGYTLDGDFKK